IYLNKFSPTGFYSSAVENNFLRELKDRESMQVEYRTEPEGYHTEPLPLPPRGRPVYINPEDMDRVKQYQEQGYNAPMKTPDSTLIFVTHENSQMILKDQIDCMGCLSHCSFSNWKDHDDFTTGKKADP